jgi:hypothetical protein
MMRFYRARIVRPAIVDRFAHRRDQQHALFVGQIIIAF